jgi:hypothetical protein
MDANSSLKNCTSSRNPEKKIDTKGNEKWVFDDRW